jgi:hypothetical protein
MSVRLKKQPSARHFRKVEELAKRTCLNSGTDDKVLCSACSARQLLNGVAWLGENAA